MGIAAVFGITATILLAAGIAVRPRQRLLSNVLLVSAGVVVAMPLLSLLTLYIHRNDPP